MVEFTPRFINKRFLFNGKPVKAVAETDSGNVKVIVNGAEVWTDFTQLQDIDGASKLFRVFPLPALAAA